MTPVRFLATCSKPFDDFRRDLEQAISVSQVSHLLRHSWKQQNMSIAGPGAHGTLRFHQGRVQAELHISFPATMIKPRIVGDIRRMLEAASGGPVSVTG
jgi:hypothetical protein